MKFFHKSKSYNHKTGVVNHASFINRAGMIVMVSVVFVGASVLSTRLTNKQNEQRHGPRKTAVVGVHAINSASMRWADFMSKIYSKNNPWNKKRLKRTTPAVTAPVGSGAPQTPPANSITETHQNIISSVFWIGEEASSDNGYIANAMSAWDGNWQQNYGGYDSPTNRNGYLPAGFTPKENPFYVALPYNDIDENGDRKSSANFCPNASNSLAQGYSWCKNSWVKISFGTKTVYAQWQDVGPYEEDDAAYVFGTAKPINRLGVKAGIDVSPAVRDYLIIGDVNTVSWSFVSAEDVPDGPWKQIITTSKGYRVN